MIHDPMLTPMEDVKILSNKACEVTPDLSQIRGISEGISQGTTLENVLRQLDNGHALLMIKRPRVKGFCVSCIKKLATPHYKQLLTKVITHCPGKKHFFRIVYDNV